MIEATELIPYRSSSIDYEASQRLKATFRNLRGKRTPFYLTLEEFYEILRWKLGGQYARQRAERVANTEHVIRIVTGAAFAVTHEDED